MVQINIDPEEMLSYCNGSCCLVGDCRLVLEALYEELAQSEQADREEWVKLVQTARSEWFALKKAEEVPAGALLSPQQVMRKLQDIFDERTCIVSDASFSSSWVAEFIVQTQIGRRCFFPRGLALLGWALPAAVGICETGLYDRVIVVAGDGGFSYSLSELATVAEHEYPILSVVLNNSSLGWYRIIHTIYFSEGESETGKSKHLAFDAIARGYGIPSASTDQYEKLCAEIDRFSAYSGPAVLNIDTHWQSTPIWSLRQELEKMQPSDL